MKNSIVILARSYMRGGLVEVPNLGTFQSTGEALNMGHSHFRHLPWRVAQKFESGHTTEYKPLSAIINPAAKVEKLAAPLPVLA